ncbi:NAD(P)-binding protein [Artomyces pyxidatus]|uniref:NAD(P)-binding protein n=1 Tax=Artomyces pyxidatus TaxID=48021 RepID=A0ACB8SEI8_9AGAM|nr:NAD(P)-binding protein [Artomyces pyxidatus]
MSGFKNFALAGAGGIGIFVVEELLKAKALGFVDKITILTRTQSGGREALEKLAATGAIIAAVDYADSSAITQALAGVDVVISTLPWAAIEAEMVIAEASAAAGAKLFVPSSYGLPALASKLGKLSASRQIRRETLKSMGLPYVQFACGLWSDIMFTDSFWAPLVNLEIATGKVTIGGDGNKPLSLTARPDVASFLVYALIQFPVEKLEYQSFRMEGDRNTCNELFSAYETKTGKKLEITYRSIGELETAIAANPSDVGAVVQHIYATGDGVIESPDNALYPNWNPTPTIDFLN